MEEIIESLEEFLEEHKIQEHSLEERHFEHLIESINLHDLKTLMFIKNELILTSTLRLYNIKDFAEAKITSRKILESFQKIYNNDTIFFTTVELLEQHSDEELNKFISKKNSIFKKDQITMIKYYLKYKSAVIAAKELIGVKNGAILGALVSIDEFNQSSYNVVKTIYNDMVNHLNFLKRNRKKSNKNGKQPCNKLHGFY